MCDIKLNSTDYGVILIKKICKKLQPKIEHLKTAISGVKNTDEQRIIILRLISWAWENIGSSVKQWKQLAKDFITTYAKEIACCLQNADTKSGTIDIPRNKRMLLYCFVSQLLDEGVFGECLYITIEKYTIFQLKSIPVLIVCEDKKSYLNAG